MLSSEIKRRTRFLLPISTRLLSGRPHIIVCSLDKLPNLDIRIKQRLEAIESPEGFVVEVSDDQRERPLVFACGRTPRATLFAVGKLLRALKMRRDFLAVGKGLSIVTGIVFGPQVRIPLPQLCDLVPDRYPIRLYPDITHSRQCQFPVPNWDMAFAFTKGRECINPRPR